MPFTFAHPAAALPLRRTLGRAGVLSALVGGRLCRQSPTGTARPAMGGAWLSRLCVQGAAAWQYTPGPVVACPVDMAVVHHDASAPRVFALATSGSSPQARTVCHVSRASPWRVRLWYRAHGRHKRHPYLPAVCRPWGYHRYQRVRNHSSRFWGRLAPLGGASNTHGLTRHERALR